MTKRNKILIYCDYGCANINNLEKTLKQEFPESEVGYTDAARIIMGALDETVQAFFMPGGAATPYRKKLDELGNKQIKNYVANGGTYFGICAGAYYACKKVEFEAGIPELAISREEGLLNLVEATAIGTLHTDFGLAPYSLNANAAKTVALEWCEDKARYYSYYHGGPYFEVAPNEDCKVLAIYAEAKGYKPAILSKTYGKGQVLLSGVHFEDRGEDLLKCIHSLQIDAPQALKNAQELIAKEPERAKLATKLVNIVKNNTRK